MELTLSMPRLAVIERRIAGSVKYGVRLHRPPRPPLKIKTITFKPGEPEPRDQGAGTLTVCVIQTGLEVAPVGEAQAFTPEAEPGISTAAAGPPAPPRKERPASRRTRAATKPAPRPKRQHLTTSDLLATIATLERRKAELEHKPGPRPARELVPHKNERLKRGPADKAAGPGRKPRQRDGRGRQHREPK